MKIAFIGQNTIDTPATELGTRYVRAGHEVFSYAKGVETAMHYNGIRFYAFSNIFSIIHAALFLRADIIHLLDHKPMKWLVRFLRPGAVVLTTKLLHGINPRRVTTDDVLLQSFGVRSGDYALAQGIDSTVKEHWKEEMPLIVLDDSVSPSTRSALFAGSKFVILSSEATFKDALEAMSYGRAVLVPEQLDGLQFIDQAVIPYTKQNLGNIVQEFVSDPMHVAAIGHAARGFVESEFHWNVVAGQLLEVYRDLCYSRAVWMKTRNRQKN